MDKSNFSTEGGAGSYNAAASVVRKYRKYGSSSPVGEPSARYCVYDSQGRYDISEARAARQYIDQQLWQFKQPVIVKIRCVGDELNMYVGQEFFVVITGSGGPFTYYTYMDLKIEADWARDIACDVQNNRFVVDDPERPILRDPTGAYVSGSCAYEVIKVY